VHDRDEEIVGLLAAREADEFTPALFGHWGTDARGDG
jgi:hypothetical protein